MKKTHLAIGTLLAWVTVGAGCAEPAPEKLFEMASEAVAAGEQRTAEIHLKNLLRQEPDNVAARFLLGQVALDNGDPVAAEAALRRALELGAEPAEVQLPLVRAILSQGRGADALAQIRNSPGLTDDARVAELRLEGTAYRTLNRNAEAEASFRAALALDPKSVEVRTDLATLMLAQNRMEDGRRFVVEVLTDEPTYAPALLLRGLLELSSGRVDEAEATMREVVEREGRESDSYFGAMSQLVEVLTAKGDIEEATRTARTLIEAFPSHPIPIVLMADIEIRQGDLDTAKRRLEELLTRAPSFSAASRLLGVVNARQGQTQQAVMNFQRAITQSPTDVNAVVHLAHLQLQQNDFATARMVLAASAGQQTNNDAMLFALAARTALRVREDEIAERFLEEAARLASGNPESQLAVASVFIDAGQPERATELLQASAASGTDTAWVGLFGLALTQTDARAFDDADATIARLIEAQPGVAWPINLRGMVAAAAQNLDAAQAHFSTAIAMEPAYLPALLNRARVHLLSGRRAAAVADYRAVLERDASNANALFVLAELSLAEQNFDEAERLLARVPESAPRLRLEGAVAFGRGDFESAAEKIDRAFADEPSADLALQAFNARRRAGRPNPQAPLQTWIAEHPRDVSVNATLGSYALQTGDFAAAVSRFEAVLAEQSEHAEALNNLAWLYSQRNDSRALAFAERAYAAAPGNPAIADTLGWIYVSNGDVRKGLPLLEESHAALPENAEIHYHFAAALAEAGEEERAAQSLRALLAAHESFAERAAAQQLLQRLE